ncbi:MAG: hypothetical protein ACLTRS_09895 [Lachnospiraceae bacterium]
MSCQALYYVREADAVWDQAIRQTVLPSTVECVTQGTTADVPVMCETIDVPLNDPLGIQINKINIDGTTIADLSG